MKKSILKIVSVLMLSTAFVALICAVTVTGGGLLTLSNIARAAFVVIAFVFAGAGLVTAGSSSTKAQ